MSGLQDPRTCQTSLDSPFAHGTRTQTLKLRFLYVTDSTLNPMVGIVVTTSPICFACQHAHYEIRMASIRSKLNCLRCSFLRIPSVCTTESFCRRCPAFVISNAASTVLLPRCSYKSQDEYPCLLLCPDQPRKLGDIAAHGVYLLYSRGFRVAVQLARAGGSFAVVERTVSSAGYETKYSAAKMVVSR